MPIKWNLRMAMAKKGIWTGADLQRQLHEKAGLIISTAGISRLLREDQSEIKLRIIDALCTVLECELEELLVLESNSNEVLIKNERKELNDHN